jgi:acyl-CoA hydrolase
MNVAELRRSPEAVLEHIADGAHVIVGVANGEPAKILDTIEANADRFHDVRLHQMLPVRKRRYIDGDFPGLRHVSWFLSPASRSAFHAGACDLVPNNFSDVPHLMRSLKPSLVVAAVSPADRHGYFSLGCHAEYVARVHRGGALLRRGESPDAPHLRREPGHTWIR